MSRGLNRFGSWLLTQLTWRSLVRTTGLVLMVYLVVSRQHPDASALVACATMIGLASFVQLVDTVGPKGKDEDKDGDS